VVDRAAAVRLELAEAEGYHDLAAAAPPDVRVAVGIRAARLAGATALAAAALPTSRLLNHVLGLGLTEPADERALEAVARFYREQAPQVDWFAAPSPHARPGGLTGRLVAAGFRPDYAWAKFARGPQAPPEPPAYVPVRPARPRDAGAFGRIAAEAFGLPAAAAGWLAALVGRERWTCLLAWEGDEPVATGALFVDGGTAWLTFGATRPAHRGRGAQRALLAARIALAAELGCDLLATETGDRVAGRPDASYRNILASGFAVAYVRPNLRRPAPPPSS